MNYQAPGFIKNKCELVLTAQEDSLRTVSRYIHTSQGSKYEVSDFAIADDCYDTRRDLSLR